MTYAQVLQERAKIKKRVSHTSEKNTINLLITMMVKLYAKQR